MFKPFEPEIKVVHISTKKEYAGETQMTWFRDLLESKVSYPKLDFELLFSDDIFESLKAYLNEVSPEMVVMLERKKKGGIINWFQRNMVKKMGSYGKIPVLSFNEANHQTFYFW